MLSILLTRNPQIPNLVFPLVVNWIWDPLESLVDFPHSLFPESSKDTARIYNIWSHVNDSCATLHYSLMQWRGGRGDCGGGGTVHCITIFSWGFLWCWRGWVVVMFKYLFGWWSEKRILYHLYMYHLELFFLTCKYVCCNSSVPLY